jgi:deoxyribodipyrimidine photo-lyase
VDCAVVLFTRDLRVHDQPALRAALDGADRIVPLFVLDDGLVAASPNRTAFLLDALHDLRSSLRERGGTLAVRRGDRVEEALRVAREHGAGALYTSGDVTPTATRRAQRLSDACANERIELVTCPGVTVVPADDLHPSSGDHYRVFTPYWRAWRAARWRDVIAPPRRVEVPADLAAGAIPAMGDVASGDRSSALCRGGETAGRELLRSWGRSGLAHYGERHNDLAAEGTSRISPYLHFGCVSPLELAVRFGGRPGGGSFLRQMCWRDFYHQVTSAFGRITTAEYRPRGDRWRRSEREFEAWRCGRTGYPIVDAGMRQLLAEGWMHNRARLITASFLTKDLYLDWRLGERHFFRWLVDGDVASNGANWQWIAGTGNDTRPNRMFNPLRQAERFDPTGDYVRRYVPELASVEGPAVHRPWELEPDRRAELDYPDRIVDHRDAVARFRAARAAR